MPVYLESVVELTCRDVGNSGSQPSNTKWNCKSL